MSDIAPAYRGPVLHFDALGLVALREGDRIFTPPRLEAVCSGCVDVLTPRFERHPPPGRTSASIRNISFSTTPTSVSITSNSLSS